MLQIVNRDLKQLKPQDPMVVHKVNKVNRMYNNQIDDDDDLVKDKVD
jgi:hypothetical protein